MDDLPLMDVSASAGVRDITLMDLWLIVSARRRLAGSIVAAAALIGVVLALTLPPQYQFKTAIEIGDEIVNAEIRPSEMINAEVQPIEAATTVIAKLQNGYIPVITTAFIAKNPDGPKHYDFEVLGSEKSQIVTLVSQGPRRLADKHIELHKEIAQALVDDHNRTSDDMRGNARMLLAQAQAMLDGQVAAQKSLAEQVATLDRAIADIDRRSADIDKRVAQLEAEQGSLHGDASRATQALLITQELGQLKALQAGLGERKAQAGISRAETQAKLDTNAAEQAAARDSIAFREITLKNIRATRSLGTVTSVEPVAPNKPVVVAVALVVGLLLAVLVALADDFFSRARLARAARSTR